MVKNFLKIAWRNLIRNKTYSLINILGLAIGIAAAILVTIYVTDELSYDQFHSRKDNTYRLSFTEQRQDGLFKYAKIPFPVKQVLIDAIPEIEEITRLYSVAPVSGAPMIHVDEEVYAEPDLWFTDPNLFEVFDFELIAGNPETALYNERSAVITEETALKYFGNDNPIGKKISYHKNTTLEVTGIVKKPPANSHIQFDLLLPVEMLRQLWIRNYDYDFEADWRWSGSYSYVLLKEDHDLKSFTERTNDLIKTHCPEVSDSYGMVSFPMKDIYLQSEFAGEMHPVGSLDQLYVFAVIAFLVLMVAWINFMNLATARSMRRAREVGIRKVMGAYRQTLIFQFLGEAMLIAIVSMAHALLIINLTLPMFNFFTGKNYSFTEVFLQPEVLITSVAITVITGLFSGIYPAFFLSSFRPIKTLRNDIRVGGSTILRKALVILQFATSIVFIAAVVVINEQLEFMHNKDLGFDREQVVVINNRTLDKDEYELFSNVIKNNPDVLQVYFGHIPGRKSWGNTVQPEGRSREDAIKTNLIYTGYDFTDFFKIELVAGRTFDPAIDEDTVNARSAFLINEEMVKLLSWGDEAVGKEFQWIGGNNNRQLIKGKVVGVIGNFHHASLYSEITPLIVRLSDWGEVAVKYNSQKTADLVPYLEKTWNEMFPTQRFDHSFLDLELKEQYEKEENLSKLINYFTILAIFISCMGLFGLASFIVEQRKKEFAIRKTLGATIRQISGLISGDFGKLVVIAAILGCPVAWYFLQEWLNGFVYRIDISIWYFGMALGVGLMVAFSTISLQVLKAARANPVDSLRNE